MRDTNSNRRQFLHTAAGLAALPGMAIGQAPLAGPPERRVSLVGDGVTLTPSEYARLLAKIADEHANVADSYLHGGAVEELEQRFAKLLGKERALFMPTGTLANHMAARELAGEKRRVIVQQESHLYCDEGDCAQFLSGLNLTPLAPGRATMKLEEVAAVVERSASPPYPVPVGAISIESPVRRQTGEVADFEEMKKVTAYCREKKIGTHLDGARVFLASGYSGVSPAQYAALFDTVYVSMYKYFNAPFGAILVGPAVLMDRIATLRHQFGSLVYHGWQSAAVALHYFEGFTERYQTAVRNGETLFKLLAATGKVQVERVKNGSNIAAIKLASGTTDVLQQKLAAAGIVLRGAKDSARTNIQINETLIRRSPAEIAQEFAKALA
jgi:threonine aldolase